MGAGELQDPMDDQGSVAKEPCLQVSGNVRVCVCVRERERERERKGETNEWCSGCSGCSDGCVRCCFTCVAALVCGCVTVWV